MKKITVFCTGLFLAGAFTAQAGTITSWNMDNVTVTPPPYTLYELYDSTLFTDSTKNSSNGAIYWKESDVQAPGLQVINNDVLSGENCLMTTGYNLETGAAKTCSDPFQSSKRWKAKAYENKPLDVYFSVIDDRSKQTYRSLQKLTNATNGRLQGFTMELGFMVNGEFVASTAGDGLGFSERRGRYFEGTVTYDPAKPDVLSAFFPHDIAGAPDANHEDPGYYIQTERMYIDLEATEDKITSTGISQNHLDILGEWHTANDVPVAFFYDGDNDPVTDAELMASCEWDYDPDTLECLGEWVTYRGCIGLDGAGEPCDPDGVRKVISQSIIDEWTADPQWAIDYFDDVANLTLNYFITVDRKMNWPTPDQFVLRINTVASDAQVEDPTEPGDNPTDPGDEPTDPPAVEDEVDVAVTAVDVPRLKRGESGEISVTLNNQYAGAVDGLLTLTVTDLQGNEFDRYATGFTTEADTSATTLSFPWTAPSERTTVRVTATVEGVAGEENLSDNTLSETQRIN